MRTDPSTCLESETNPHLLSFTSTFGAHSLISSLPYPAIYTFAQKIGVPAVTGILLNPVHHEFANCDSILAQTFA
jgi:hypothetical protein